MPKITTHHELVESLRHALAVLSSEEYDLRQIASDPRFDEDYKIEEWHEFTTEWVDELNAAVDRVALVMRPFPFQKTFTTAPRK